MRIAPMVTFVNKAANASFKQSEKPKNYDEIPENIPDDTVVRYGTCGPNYVYPITAGQLRELAKQRKEVAEKMNTTKTYDETPEEYLKRKLYSIEWTT